MKAKDLKRALIRVCDKILENEDKLTAADSYIGDGDHGIGMTRGFKEAKVKLESTFSEDIAIYFDVVGDALFLKSGGASGAIFGTLFKTIAESTKNSQYLTVGLLHLALQSALDAVMKLGGAVPGDKTMVDALHPACKISNTEMTLIDALKAITDAALKGVENTKQMVAKHGKAKSLGDRAVGYPDPGSITLSLIFSAIYEYAVNGSAFR